MKECLFTSTCLLLLLLLLQGTDGEACAWCGKGSFFGSPCVSESVAKYIPPSFAKCKIGKKGKKSDVVEEGKVAVA
jgi:hypothetical protein